MLRHLHNTCTTPPRYSLLPPLSSLEMSVFLHTREWRARNTLVLLLHSFSSKPDKSLHLMVCMLYGAAHDVDVEMNDTHYMLRHTAQMCHMFRYISYVTSALR